MVTGIGDCSAPTGEGVKLSLYGRTGVQGDARQIRSPRRDGDLDAVPHRHMPPL